MSQGRSFRTVGGSRTHSHPAGRLADAARAMPPLSAGAPVKATRAPIRTRSSTPSHPCWNSRPSSKARCRRKTPRRCAPGCSTNWCAARDAAVAAGVLAGARRPGGLGGRGAARRPRAQHAMGRRQRLAAPAAGGHAARRRRCWHAVLRPSRGAGAPSEPRPRTAGAAISTAWRSASAANTACPAAPAIARSTPCASRPPASCAMPTPKARRCRQTGKAWSPPTSRRASSCRSG